MAIQKVPVKPRNMVILQYLYGIGIVITFVVFVHFLYKEPYSMSHTGPYKTGLRLILPENPTKVENYLVTRDRLTYFTGLLIFLAIVNAVIIRNSWIPTTRTLYNALGSVQLSIYFIIGILLLPLGLIFIVLAALTLFLLTRPDIKTFFDIPPEDREYRKVKIIVR